MNLQSLRVISLNARSVLNKLHLFNTIFLSYHPYAVVITESLLHEDVQDPEVIPPAYKLIRKDRTSRGGGAIKNNIPYEVLDEIPDHESIWCRITLHCKRITLGEIYRAPSSPPEYLGVVTDYLAKHTNSQTNLILTSDFNLPGINWVDMMAGNPEVLNLSCSQFLRTH